MTAVIHAARIRVSAALIIAIAPAAQAAETPAAGRAAQPTVSQAAAPESGDSATAKKSSGAINLIFSALYQVPGFSSVLKSLYSA
ncbi:hypothetical protein [Streptomyces syringium]|uniref:hypothetical protein n=1 Tax=Streptomyces syringium TaxID=76729 RepID=UPI00342107F1